MTIPRQSPPTCFSPEKNTARTPSSARLTEWTLLHRILSRRKSLVRPSRAPGTAQLQRFFFFVSCPFQQRRSLGVVRCGSRITRFGKQSDQVVGILFRVCPDVGGDVPRWLETRRDARRNSVCLSLPGSCVAVPAGAQHSRISSCESSAGPKFFASLALRRHRRRRRLVVRLPA